jgi:hypothetical protein
MAAERAAPRFAKIPQTANTPLDVERQALHLSTTDRAPQGGRHQIGTPSGIMSESVGGIIGTRSGGYVTGKAGT